MRKICDDSKTGGKPDRSQRTHPPVLRMKSGLLKPAGLTEAGYRLYDENRWKLSSQDPFSRDWTSR